ncbi:MAG: transketolase C-terminal domain-containing protein [Synergistaceae bacterium]|nr:transketolase C-terminal domain-containing protein [Synergistaceae bacterium]
MIEYSERNIRAWSMLGPSGVFGTFACEFAEADKEFVALTSDLCYFSGLNRFNTAYPDRFFNVGIAEQNMVGIAAGMAKEGMNVFASTYATFASTRVLDQVKLNMGYMNLPVKLVGLTSGFSAGILGATHMSLEDIAIMRSIPNIVLLSPADCTETMKALMAAGNMKSPVYIRMSGASRSPVVYKGNYNFQVGKAVQLREGKDIAIIATGTMVSQAVKVSEMLEEQNIFSDVFDFHTIKPIDKDTILSASNKKLIITIEEHSKIGGLGSAIAEVLAPEANRPRQLIISTEDSYPHAATYEALIKRSGLSVVQICETILNFIKEKC